MSKTKWFFRKRLPQKHTAESYIALVLVNLYGMYWFLATGGSYILVLRLMVSFSLLAVWKTEPGKFSHVSDTNVKGVFNCVCMGWLNNMWNTAMHFIPKLLPSVNYVMLKWKTSQVLSKIFILQVTKSLAGSGNEAKLQQQPQHKHHHLSWM